MLASDDPLEALVAEMSSLAQRQGAEAPQASGTSGGALLMVRPVSAELGSKLATCVAVQVELGRSIGQLRAELDRCWRRHPPSSARD